MMNSSPPQPIRRLIIRSGSATHRPDHTKDELIAAEALLMLSRTIIPPAPLLHKKNDRHHKCSLCEMTFSTHQALGGHMTRHRNKTKQNTTPAAAKKKEEVLAIMMPPASGDKSDVVSDMTECVEKISGIATFSTGQQLGGHKRSRENESDESESRLLVLFDQQPSRYAAASTATIATVHPDLDLDLKLCL